MKATVLIVRRMILLLVLGAADEAAMLDLVNIIRMDLHDFAGFH